MATSARNAPSCWPFRGAIRVSIRPVLTEELRPPAPGGKARENAHHSKTKVMHLFKIRSDAVFRSICIVCPFLLLHCVTICPIYQHASFWHIRATPTLLLFCRTQTNLYQKSTVLLRLVRVILQLYVCRTSRQSLSQRHSASPSHAARVPCTVRARSVRVPHNIRGR